MILTGQESTRKGIWGDYWSMTTVSLLVPTRDFARVDFCH